MMSAGEQSAGAHRPGVLMTAITATGCWRHISMREYILSGERILLRGVSSQQVGLAEEAADDGDNQIAGRQLGVICPGLPVRII